MTPQDREEIQARIDAAVVNLNAIRKLEHENILDKLDAIITQTTLTNGTVRKHTEQISLLDRMLPHTSDNCPNKTKIDAVYMSHVTNSAMKKWFITSITITSLLVGIVVALATTFIIFMK